MKKHADDFDVRKGPTERQKWQAFWRLYRMSKRHHWDSLTSWQVLAFDGPLYWAWVKVAEDGDIQYREMTLADLYRTKRSVILRSKHAPISQPLQRCIARKIERINVHIKHRKLERQVQQSLSDSKWYQSLLALKKMESN